MAKRKKLFGMNRHQKKSHRRREDRLRGNEVEYYLELAYSEDADERVIAMDNLCPCHVRKHIDKVWVALFRGLVDPDLRVRRAAWHTLEDGGNPDDRRLEPLLEKIVKEETDPRLRQNALNLIAEKQKTEDRKSALVGMKVDYFDGKCDWCGATNVPVTHDYETELEVGNTKRFALTCENCG